MFPSARTAPPPDRRPAGVRTRAWYLAVGGVLGLVYVLLPRGPLAQGMFVAIALSVPAVGLVARRRVQAAGGPAWAVLGAGFALAAVGEVVDFGVVTLAGHRGTTAAIDLIFLTAYIVQLCGLMSLFQAHTVSRRRFGWFDAVAVAVVVGTLVWTTMYEAIFGNGRGTPLDLITRFGGAVIGVALLVTALRLVVTTRGRLGAFTLLLVAFGLQLVMDSIGALWRGYAPGSRFEVLWAVAYVLSGAALVDTGDTTTMRQAPTRQASVEIRHTLVLQAGVTLVLAALIIVEVGSSIPVATSTVWACAWVVILVVTRVRLFGLLRMVGAASATENQLRLTAMVAGSSDVIGLADPDGTIRYLTPSIARLTGVAVDQWIGQRFDLVLERHLGGIDDLAVRCANLAPSDEVTWECTAVAPDGGGARTVKLTVANQTATPEVNGWVITAHDITDEARLTAELRHQSLHDTLTGLPNRALLFDRIQHALARMTRVPDARLAVVLVDIDDFKAVNDSLGHTTGDELLRAVGQRLAASVRQGDTVARLGGDEFALLLEDVDVAEAVALAQRALENLALPVQIGTADLAVRASAGVVSQGAAGDAVALLRAADIAMYASKRDGKAKVSVFDDAMHETAQQQLELRMDLTRALERDELRVVYQPIVDARTRRIAGCEALLRWQHPRRGTVSPLDFIPIAEQTGHILPIGAWVLRTACFEAASWSGPAATAYISVNVSAPQMADEGFVDLVLETLADTGLAPRRLLIEITESMLVDDTEHATSALAVLRARGVRVAIDDFGTGYSSLAYLRSLSADVVKIDRSFVHDLSTNPDHQALTRTILTLAQGLEMSAIAEGLETEADFAALVRLGCPYAQGFLFSRPVPADALAALFAEMTRPDEATTSGRSDG